MGKIKDNVVTRGFSGKLGEDLVFRQVDNKTVFSKRTLSSKPPSAQQLELRNLFTEATQYASGAIEDPEESVEYKLMAEVNRLKSAYTAAVTDFLTLPEITSAFTRRYKGLPGQFITITPKMPYKIIEIEVSITDANGTVIETGMAVARELKWRYTTTVQNNALAGSRLVLIARDRPGKEFRFEKSL